MSHPPLDGSSFYAVSSIINANGTCDWNCEAPVAVASFAAAVQETQDRNDPDIYGDEVEAIIFECRAVSRVTIRSVVQTDVRSIQSDALPISLERKRP